MANCVIYFPIFSETIHTILTIFHSMILGRLGNGYCKKDRVLEFLAKIFS